jgi:hypothetical protein
MTNPIYKGDNTAAFGNNFITIELDNPLGYTVSKVEFVVNGGCPKIPPIENPAFPLYVNFTSQQTAQLKPNNVGQLVVWDAEGRQKTCEGKVVFSAQNGVISNVGSCC